jgi:hypothetical protein
MFSHPVVGMQIKSPRAEDASRDAWPPFVAWQWLIREARWQAETVMVSGHRLQLQRGQLSHSQRHLARQFNWGHKAVREFLARLARHGMIDVETQNLRSVNVCGTSKTGTDKGTATTVITVRNYGVYQQTPQQEGTANGTAGAQEGHRRGTKEKKVTREEPIEEVPNGTLASDAAAEPSKQIDPLTAFNEYNELALKLGIPQAGKMTPDRRKKIAARLREHGGMPAWREALAKLGQSNFLLGRNSSGWTANLDFLVRPANFAKLLDGGYDNRSPFVVDRNPETENDRRTRELLAVITAPLAANGDARK